MRTILTSTPRFVAVTGRVSAARFDTVFREQRHRLAGSPDKEREWASGVWRFEASFLSGRVDLDFFLVFFVLFFFCSRFNER